MWAPRLRPTAGLTAREAPLPLPGRGRRLRPQRRVSLPMRPAPRHGPAKGPSSTGARHLRTHRRGELQTRLCGSRSQADSASSRLLLSRGRLRRVRGQGLGWGRREGLPPTERADPGRLHLPCLWSAPPHCPGGRRGIGSESCRLSGGSHSRDQTTRMGRLKTGEPAWGPPPVPRPWPPAGRGRGRTSGR